MKITIPDELLNGTQLTPAEARLDLALGMYVDERATLGRAAEIAGMSQAQFLKHLGRRKIPVHYDGDDLSSDLKTIQQL